MAGLLGWTYLTLFVLAWGGRAILVHQAVFFYLFGYVYFLLSLYPCFKKPSIKALSIMGLVLNVPMAVLFIYWVSHLVDYLTPGAFVPLAYILVWTFLWIARWFVDRNISARSQAVTMTLVAGVLVLGAATVWPLTIDHESEARRFLQAAVTDNAMEARANFSEALRHATHIRNDADKIQFLQQIAMAQAQLRLYDESSDTIKTYLGNSLEEHDKEYLLTSIVRTQVKNKDYEIALATAKVMNAAGRFQVQSLTLEAVSTAKEGKAEEARQILDTAITLANEQKDMSKHTMAFMHIAEAQAKIGWHDGALNSAPRAGTENLFAILGMIGANEAEAGYKESARQTMQVIYETLGIAVEKCLSHRTVERRDRCQSKLVIELGDYGFFHLARSTATQISSISERDLAFRKISDFQTKYLNRDREEIIKQ